MASQYSIVAWKIQWTEETGGLQSLGLQRTGNDWTTNTHWNKYTTEFVKDKLIEWGMCTSVSCWRDVRWAHLFSPSKSDLTLNFISCLTSITPGVPFPKPCQDNLLLHCLIPLGPAILPCWEKKKSLLSIGSASVPFCGLPITLGTAREKVIAPTGLRKPKIFASSKITWNFSCIFFLCGIFSLSPLSRIHEIIGLQAWVLETKPGRKESHR